MKDLDHFRRKYTYIKNIFLAKMGIWGFLKEVNAFIRFFLLKLNFRNFG
jgi:hypothetical protein